MSTTADIEEVHYVAKSGFDVFLWLTYFCLLISYVNINIIVFRFWLIMSGVFFIIFATIPENAIQIDTLLFNIAYIIINVIMMIPLVKQVLPVKFTPLEEEIYNRDFKTHMTRAQFKRFISKFKALKYQDKAQLCAIKSQFTHLFYIAKLFPGWKIQLKSHSDVAFKSIHEGGWIGTIEYVLFEETRAKKEKKKDNSEVIVSWGITAEICRESDLLQQLKEEPDVNQESESNNYENENILKESGAIIYKIDIEVILNKINLS